jgi:AraC-like DNA-binding protein
VGYREVPVPLAGLAECGWTVSGPAVDRPVLPDGAMDLVWTGTALLVAGPDTVAHPAGRPPGTTVSGIRFRPGVLPALLGVPAHALRDERVPLADLHRGAAAVAGGLIEGARPIKGTVGGDPADGALAALVAAARALPGSADRALLAVADRLGAGASARGTADALGWTTRTLHRRSLAAFGYGPAVLRRVLRFRRAVGLLHAGCAPAEVAARAGYADQPHLSREVRELAGRSPAELFAARGQPGSGA